MRRLVLATMVACIATLATGCIISSDDDDTPPDDVGFIRADWTFHDVAGASLGCPAGFDTATVTATPTTAGGTPFIDLYDCVAGTGTADYDIDEYDVSIDIDNDANQLYATSLVQRVDITVNDGVVAEDFIDDGGRIIFDWVLVGAANQPLTCAGIGGDKVSITSTLVGTANAVEDTFPCEDDGTGITDPILAGTYTLALDVLDASGGALGGSSTTKTNVVIEDQNGYTDIGTVMILAE
jgi:hypothetical protein